MDKPGMNVAAPHRTPSVLGPDEPDALKGCKKACAACNVRNFAVCGSMRSEELIHIEAIVQTERLEPRQTLFQEGDVAGSVFTVTSGTLRLQHDLKDGRRQIVGFALPGDFLGLSLPEHYGFSADALTGVEACRFDRKRFILLTETQPSLLRRLHEVTSHELSLAQEHMVVLGRRKAEERVAAFLVGWWRRVQKLKGPSPTVPLPMGRQDIADHLGLTIETVSRTLARWMREKIILDVPNGVRVLDEERLVALMTDGA